MFRPVGASLCPRKAQQPEFKLLQRLWQKYARTGLTDFRKPSDHMHSFCPTSRISLAGLTRFRKNGAFLLWRLLALSFLRWP